LIKFDEPEIDEPEKNCDQFDEPYLIKLMNLKSDETEKNCEQFDEPKHLIKFDEPEI
jgi:hypothetical protein